MENLKIDNVPHVALLYKCLINESIVDNHHNAVHLEDWLKGVPELIVPCDSDLTKFYIEFNENKGLVPG